MTKHSAIGASSAARWMTCPGSVELCKKAPPQEQSSYALEGTAAHELSELCLVNKAEPSSFIGEKMKCGLEVTEEMAEAVSVYVNTVEEYQRNGKYIRLTEAKFDLSCIYPGLFGTSDCVLVSSDLTSLVVFDYKHGAGKAVDVVENKQLLYYALGAISYCHVVKEWVDDPTIFGWGEKLKHIELVIVQPRCRHKDGEVRSWTVDSRRLNEFADELKAAAVRTEAKDAPLDPGSHCRWCPAMGVCPAIGKQALELAQADFSAVPPSFPAPDTLAIERVGQILSFSDLFSDWIKAVEAYALSLLEQGVEVPGFKLVKKRANRAWQSEDVAADKLGLLLSDSQIWTKKLISPAQAEKLIGKSKISLIQDLITVPDNGNTLAPEHDKRPAVASSVIADFN